MRFRILAAFSMTVGILAATIGFAGPVAAAPSWVMPDVRGAVLSQAVKAVEGVTGGAELDLRLIDGRNGQEVINQTNWMACAQYPGPGREISQRTKRILLYVKRFNQARCRS